MAQGYNRITEDERLMIEKALNQGSNLTDISRITERDISTIRREIQNHRQESRKTGFGRTYNNCSYGYKCEYKPLYCNGCNRTTCSRCNVCNDYCSKYSPSSCDSRDKKPYVCNGCDAFNKCPLTKYIYHASVAQKEAEEIRSESRKGINQTPEELEVLRALVDDRIKEKGQSVNHLIVTEPDLINVCSKTIYKYIDMGLFDTRNIDLTRAVKFSPRKTKVHHKVDRNCTVGRTYEDFLQFIAENPDIDIVEIDTVEGKKGESCLLTIFFRNCSVQLSFKRETNNAKSVQNIFDEIYLLVGHEKFEELFPVILTDNGTEFSNPKAIENYIEKNDETGELTYTKRTTVFYCDPSAPGQKGACEKNHEFIRRFIPKGHSFNPFSQEDIDIMMNNINNYIRTEKKNLKSPLSRFKFLYGNDTADMFGMITIKPEDVTLRPTIFKKK